MISRSDSKGNRQELRTVCHSSKKWNWVRKPRAEPRLPADFSCDARRLLLSREAAACSKMSKGLSPGFEIWLCSPDWLCGSGKVT